MSEGAGAPLSLVERAALLVAAEAALAAAQRARNALATELLATMETSLAGAGEAAGRQEITRRIEVPGALVTYVPPGTSQRLQERLCVTKLQALGARLRDLGDADIDDAAPYTQVARAAYLKVTPRL